MFTKCVEDGEAFEGGCGIDELRCWSFIFWMVDGDGQMFEWRYVTAHIDMGYRGIHFSYNWLGGPKVFPSKRIHWLTFRILTLVDSQVFKPWE